MPQGNQALALAAKLHEHADAVARAYVDLFTEQIWEPFDKAGRPDDDWHKVLEALEGLRPLASEALLVIFQQVMSETVEEVTGREIQRGLAGGRTVYVDYDDSYALTMGQWYAVSHGLPLSRVVRLPDGGAPPPVKDAGPGDSGTIRDASTVDANETTEPDAGAPNPCAP